MLTPWILIFVLAYFLGTIPFAWIAGRIKKVDVRTLGSGNVGATNAYRVLGKRWGIGVLIGDAIKGGLASYLCFSLFGPWGGVTGGLLAMLGHSYNPFFGFRPSGKGVASGLGIICVLMPEITVITLCIFILVVALSRYVSLGSICAALSVLVLVFAFGEPAAYILFAIVAVSMVVTRHLGNIKRIMAGTESKFGKKNKE